MDDQQRERVEAGRGFVAALDQSGGSTPAALRRYGVETGTDTDAAETADLIHAMRTRIMTSPAFVADRIIAAILFDDTLSRTVDGRLTADYLWNVKGIVPFVKIDDGLAPAVDGVQLMRPIDDLDERLDRATRAGVFGTKMRSLILAAEPQAISDLVVQQFEVASRVADRGLVPIIEPEVSITNPLRLEAEHILHTVLAERLDHFTAERPVMLKLTIPSLDDLYHDFVEHPGVLRVVALSGGFDRDDACRRLARNRGMIASFSRALTEGLSVDQSADEFDERLASSVAAIAEASAT